MRRRLSVPLAAAALALAVALAGAGLLVLPQRQHVQKLDTEIAALRGEVDAASSFASSYHPEALDSADLFRLAKAMPGSIGMPDLLLQLERMAGSAGVTLDAIAPRDPVQRKGYRAVPIRLTAHGPFYSVSDFLLRLRSTVRVRGSALDVSGRLYAVDALRIDEPAGAAGDLKLAVTVSAFVYEGVSALPAGAATKAAA